MPAKTYKCDIDAEPLHRYQSGGYHPLSLGEYLKGDRYKILHKLGWGSYSTTWAAKDKKNDQYVAVKIAVADKRHNRELEVLQAVSTLPKHQPGRSHLNNMLDHFTLTGPNGAHHCLVLELTGPSVSDVVDSYCKDDRLPARFAKSFAKQDLEVLDFLARHNIGHGDLHTRNLAITIPSLNRLNEDSFLERLGKREMAPFFELITGLPPFDVSMLTPQILVQQMKDFATDDLPLRWRAKWEEMQKGLLEEDDSIGLGKWMQEVYFDSQKEDEFTSQDITIATGLIGRMLKFEPSLRATPGEILEDAWWSKV
ncbi:hypothetical protein ACHAPJ_010160 [Fusarium lateritium]